LIYRKCVSCDEEWNCKGTCKSGRLEGQLCLCFKCYQRLYGMKGGEEKSQHSGRFFWFKDWDGVIYNCFPSEEGDNPSRR